jgi:hypothetical protein
MFDGPNKMTTTTAGPSELTKIQKDIMNNYYITSKVDLDDTPGKVKSLKAWVGATSFHAYGGQETLEMELRALEWVYLVETRQAKS